MSMFNEERIFFEAWLDEENRIVSFHEIPNSRYYSAGENDFWQMIVSLILAGYRVQAANILEAECGALWAGERTAAETAAQIQKRMELYLAENAG